MKVIKTCDISGVVVTRENIRELANKINQEYRISLEALGPEYHRYVSQEFILKGTDNTQYENDDMMPFTEDGIIFTRRIIGIELEYRNLHEGKSINVSLEHSLKPSWSNRIRVSSHDENWTNGIFSSLKEIVSNWKKQIDLFGKFYMPLMLLSGIVFAFLVYRLLYLIIWHILARLNNPSFSINQLENIPFIAKAMIFASVCLYAGFSIVGTIFDKIRALYPDVELLTGPEHSQSERLKRKKLNTIIIIVIIPIILEIVLELIKII